MNNVGENFFSQPIRSVRPVEGLGRSDDDQRHRLVLYGSSIRRWGRPATPGK
jgi:hypothetical protein